MTTPFETYLARIETIYRHGNATEHTYRSALESLIGDLAPGVKASNDPQHIACGAPDFIVERGSVPLGYVETKDVGAALDKIEKDEQLKRYRQSLNNLILTDYLEFRWYVNGNYKLSARLATLGKGGKLVPDPAGLASAAQLFNEFYRTEVPTVGTPKELAGRMAQLARLVRNLIIAALQAEDSEKGALHRQYEAFQQYLLPTLKPEGFADLYAQTMAYGLFAARLSAPPTAPFSRNAAYQYLAANRFLRKLFLDVGEELDETPIAPFLDDIATLLAHADMAAILQDFGRRTRTEDPVVHFYETFLAQYDPKLRKSRGVYYTPEPVVQFIVNSVDWLLKERFARPWGLAAPDVYLLDPATGTGTFLYYALRAIHETLLARGQGGAWPDYVREKLLPRMFGFELLMAPYVIAHLKLGLLLKDMGYQMGKEDRLRIYLTNALDEGVTHAETLGDLGWYISLEASDAAQVKKDEPIMVVLGNPPYSVASANTAPWIIDLVRNSYYPRDEIKEQNPKVLLDDYVKFIRFGQWRIDKTGHGILAFITNHGYLDNPTFRRMRQNLLATFDELYVLDLHGNSKKKERAPDGSVDENVFDIQQGVAILLAVKRPDPSEKSAEAARVCHAHLWGERKAKYALLESHDLGSLEWTELQPTTPFYLFVPQNVNVRAEYERGWGSTDMMLSSANGFKTHRDSFAVAFTWDELVRRIQDFTDPGLSDSEIAEKYGLANTGDWSLSTARVLLRQAGGHPHRVVPCLYRPFDLRYCHYGTFLMDRPREKELQHALHGSPCLAVGRQGQAVGEKEWDLLTVGNCVADTNLFRRGGIQYFPLYLYAEPSTTLGQRRMLDASPWPLDAQGRTPNLAPAFVQALSARLGLRFIPDGAGDLYATYGPEDVFHYAYAVFHAPTYRARYAEFLKIDFPRLPLTADRALFATLVAKGAELVGLHLLKSPALDNTITTYPVQGSNAVEKVRFVALALEAPTPTPSPIGRGEPAPLPPEGEGAPASLAAGMRGCVYINAAQYFGGVPEEVWTFKIGGYQVCDKWLKDRKGRLLSSEEIMHYQRVVVALKETIRLMGEIDRAIPGWPIQ